jgi:hypothetical protein
MEKRIFVLLLGLLVLPFCFYLSSADNSSNFTNISAGVNANQSGFSSNLTNANRTSPLNQFGKNANNFLASNVSLPAWIKPSAIILFKFDKNEKLDLQKVIVLCSLVITFTILIFSIFRIVPLFGKGIRSFIASFIIVLLMGISGGFRSIYMLFFNLAALVKFLEKWKILAVTLELLVLVVFFFGASKAMELIKKNKELMEAEEIGRKVGAGS